MNKLYLLIVVFFVIIGSILFVFNEAWFPGITKKQTVNILLGDSKFSSRAHSKAKWHGVSIIREIDDYSSHFQDFSYSGAQNTLRLLNSIDLAEGCSIVEDLRHGENMYQKLFSLYMVSKSCGHVTSEEESLLKNVVFRSYQNLEKNHSNINDYYSEIALLSLGHVGGNSNYTAISSVLREKDVPYERHKIALQALLLTGEEEKAIKLIHEVILDTKFYATLPAYYSLLSLGDLEAEDYARKRVGMNVGGDDYLLSKELN